LLQDQIKGGQTSLLHTAAVQAGGQTHLVIVYEFVHATWAQRGAHCVCQRHAGVDVADKLRCALACVCALFQQDDLGLLQAKTQVCSVKAAATALTDPAHVRFTVT
jgi:hypothetical protein